MCLLNIKQPHSPSNEINIASGLWSRQRLDALLDALEARSEPDLSKISKRSKTKEI